MGAIPIPRWQGEIGFPEFLSKKSGEKNRPSESVFAKRRGFPYWRLMRWLRRFALFSFPVLALFLPSCVNNASSGSNPGRHPNGTGPFDRNGNYVEAWADSPSKWGRSKPTAEEVASVAADTPPVTQSEEPPSDAVPLPAAGSSTVVKSTAPRRKAGEVEVASLSKSKAKTKAGRARDEEDAPKSAKNRTRESAATAKAKTKAKHPVDDEPAVATKSKTKAAAASAKTKSKASASTASATKSKGNSHYTVKKGDNLTIIAKRNKTTVSAIQKANGLKGSTVVPGKTLVIPRS